MREFDIDLYTSELLHTVTTANLNYEIWWVYRSDQTRPKYIEAMRRYDPFFSTSIHAHFVALLIALYRLYERRADTYNIPSLLKKLRSDSNFPVATLDHLDRLHADAHSLWIKVNILRNKAFGHRSKVHTIEGVFANARVTPNELRRLIELTRDLLNQLTLAWNGESHAFNLSAERSVVRLLDDLTRLHGGIDG